MASIPEGLKVGHPQSLRRHRTFPLLQKLWLGSSPGRTMAPPACLGLLPPLSRGASAVIADDGPLRPDTAFLLLKSAAKNALGFTHCVSPQSRGHSPEPPPRPVAAPTFPRPPRPLHTGGGGGGEWRPAGAQGERWAAWPQGSGERGAVLRAQAEDPQLSSHWDENSAYRRGDNKQNIQDGTFPSHKD